MGWPLFPSLHALASPPPQSLEAIDAALPKEEGTSGRPSAAMRALPIYHLLSLSLSSGLVCCGLLPVDGDLHLVLAIRVFWLLLPPTYCRVLIHHSFPCNGIKSFFPTNWNPPLLLTISSALPFCTFSQHGH
jgi:hypothetical protein